MLICLRDLDILDEPLEVRIGIAPDVALLVQHGTVVGWSLTDPVRYLTTRLATPSPTRPVQPASVHRWTCHRPAGEPAAGLLAMLSTGVKDERTSGTIRPRAETFTRTGPVLPCVLIYGAISHLGRGEAVQQTRTALAERIAEQRRGVGDPRALVGEMRRSVLLVPTAGGGLWSARSGGVRWICGFTDEAALARFALHHAPGDQPMDYAALLGARIVDEVVPSLDEPAGLAVDIATEDGSMFFPPVVGVVADGVAVDSGEAQEGRGRGR